MENNTIPFDNLNLTDDYHVLQGVCIHSFLDECANLKEDFEALAATYEKTQDILKQHNEHMIFLAKKEAEVLERSAALIADPDWENKREEIEAIEKAASVVGQYKRDCESKKIQGEIAQKAYKFIVDCVAFSARIQRRRTFWEQFGIEQTTIVNIPKETLSSAQRKYNGTTLMQQAVMLDAQGIFILAKALFPKASEIKKELLRAVKTFKAKNIIENI